MDQARDGVSTLEAALSAQRARLVRLCTQLTGDAEAAEDLAQETLLESWRSVHKLRDQDHLAPWLSAIARNVCLRWARSHGRERSRRLAPLQDDACTFSASIEEEVPDPYDLELELDRQELAALLDRALGLLPPETRDLLIASYIHELPQAALAERLGVSEGALRVRLHRGKLALQHVLTTTLRQEASDYGLPLPNITEWQETRIWCPFCGKRRLLCRTNRAGEWSGFRCPGPCVWPDGNIVDYAYPPAVVHELTSPKAALSRLLLGCHTYYRHEMKNNQARCGLCGRPALLVRQRYEHFPLPEPLRRCYGLYIHCPTCGSQTEASIMHLALDLPETQRFWRAHSRLRILPEQEIDFAGRPALLTSLHSVTDPARLVVIAARETFEVLQVREEAGR